MEFELEYKLQQFRDVQHELFDDQDERYPNTPIGNKTAELMLELINEMEVALAEPPIEESVLPLQHVVFSEAEVCRCSVDSCLHHKGGICFAAAWKCVDRQT